MNETETVEEVKVKRGRGRPKGSKNKPKVQKVEENLVEKDDQVKTTEENEGF